MPYHKGMREVVFEAAQEADGGYCAECLTENIFTEGVTWEELHKNVIEATSAFFFDQPFRSVLPTALVLMPMTRSRLHFR